MLIKLHDLTVLHEPSRRLLTDTERQDLSTTCRRLVQARAQSAALHVLTPVQLCRRSQTQEVTSERDVALSEIRREQAAVKAQREAATRLAQDADDRAGAVTREEALLSTHKQRFETEVRPESGE